MKLLVLAALAACLAVVAGLTDWSFPPEVRMWGRIPVTPAMLRWANSAEPVK